VFARRAAAIQGAGYCDPTADQELLLVLRGHAVFELDGDRLDAPAGTLVFAPRIR